MSRRVTVEEVVDSINHVAIAEAVKTILEHIGEDPSRDGLRDTPARVARAWKEWTSGYGQDPADILKHFEEAAADEMVIVHNIPIISKCEHHLADITGIAHIGYIPNGRIIGLSKLPRLAEIFMRRLQVQERLTAEIADALMGSDVKPLGVGILIRASHACMSTRGVKIHGSLTTTCAVRGALREQGDARAEFLGLCRDAEK